MLLSVSFLCGKTKGKMTLSTFQDQDEMYGILKNINIKDKKTINWVSGGWLVASLELQDQILLIWKEYKTS